MIIKKRKILSCFTIKQQYPAVPCLFLSSKTLVYVEDGCDSAFDGRDFSFGTG
jgi:hypothetical protein